MVSKTGTSVALLAVSLILPSMFPAQVPDSGSHYEVGIVYYADGGAFKALEKEAAPQSGRSSYSARVKGAHAAVRLRTDQPQVFRVCGVDPSRFKLYRFKSEGNARTVTIAKTNMWIGGSKTVLSQSEIPVTIQNADSGCFTITPKESLGIGEFGVSPVESMDAFMFGIGEAKPSK